MLVPERVAAANASGWPEWPAPVRHVLYTLRLGTHGAWRIVHRVGFDRRHVPVERDGLPVARHNAPTGRELLPRMPARAVAPSAPLPPTS